MDDVLVIFDEPVFRDGMRYQARACGRVDDIGRWEGWLEFSADGMMWRPTGIETVQPKRRDLEYWISGLSRVYLEGALGRALSARTMPDDARRRIASSSRVGRASATAILDPFAVYSQGEGVLRAELSAVSADHLRNIAAAFRIESPETAGMLEPGELIERIVAAARGRSTRASGGEVRA